MNISFTYERQQMSDADACESKVAQKLPWSAIIGEHHGSPLKSQPPALVLIEDKLIVHGSVIFLDIVSSTCFVRLVDIRVVLLALSDGSGDNVLNRELSFDLVVGASLWAEGPVRDQLQQRGKGLKLHGDGPNDREPRCTPANDNSTSNDHDEPHGDEVGEDQPGDIAQDEKAKHQLCLGPVRPVEIRLGLVQCPVPSSPMVQNLLNLTKGFCLLQLSCRRMACRGGRVNKVAPARVNTARE